MAQFKFIGGIAGEATNMNRMEQMYVKKEVNILSKGRKGFGGGLIGQLVIGKDSRYTLENSYSRAKMEGKSLLGGLIGRIQFSEKSDFVIRKTYSGTTIKPTENIMEPSLMIEPLVASELGGSTQFDHVYNDLSSFDKKDRRHADGARDSSFFKRPIIPCLVLEDENRIWEGDQLKIENPTPFFCRAEDQKCGVFGKRSGEKCLCADFTSPSSPYCPFSCVNGTGQCKNPANSFVAFGERYDLLVKLDLIQFECGYLISSFSWPSYATSLTDLSLVLENGEQLISFSHLLSKRTNSWGSLKQQIYTKEGKCRNSIEWAVSWEKLARKLNLEYNKKSSTNFRFFFVPHTKQRREKANTLLKREFADTRLNGAIPVVLNFGSTLSVSSFQLNKQNEHQNSFEMNNKIDSQNSKIIFTSKQISQNDKMKFMIERAELSINGRHSNLEITRKKTPNCQNVDCNVEDEIEVSVERELNCINSTAYLNLDYVSQCTKKTLCQTEKASINFSFNHCPKLISNNVKTEMEMRQIGERIFEGGKLIFGEKVTVDINYQKISSGRGISKPRILSVLLVEEDDLSDREKVIDVSEYSHFLIPKVHETPFLSEISLRFKFILNRELIEKSFSDYFPSFTKFHLKVLIDESDSNPQFSINSPPDQKMNVQYRFQVHSFNFKKKPHKAIQSAPSQIRTTNLIAQSFSFQIQGKDHDYFSSQETHFDLLKQVELSKRDLSENQIFYGKFYPRTNLIKDQSKSNQSILSKYNFVLLIGSISFLLCAFFIIFIIYLKNKKNGDESVPI